MTPCVSQLSKASLGPTREPGGLLHGSDERLADVFILFLHQGKDAKINSTMVNPIQAALVNRVAPDQF